MMFLLVGAFLPAKTLLLLRNEPPGTVVLKKAKERRKQDAYN
ncbi:hypothetical protein SAMN05192532_10950 [Alteribacillus iranensis]|uniref:Uncharacterized protein n=1 Tax=Alteribacillus iranensis TaxID=930128 RepID=A0A1I2F7A8_9BACI|nr:hypothetical protein SAMN05192532_10950 [Alteribacillus iranensis]